MTVTGESVGLPVPPTNGGQRREHTIEDSINDAQAAHLRAQGLSYRQIAQQVGCDVHTAHDRVARAIAAVPVENVNELREVERARLDEMLMVAWREMHRDHVVVQFGKVVRGEDGRPLIDSGAKMAALDRLLRISRERRMLMGLDAPARSVIEVITEDTLDAEIRELEAKLGRAGESEAEAGVEGGGPALEAAETG